MMITIKSKGSWKKTTKFLTQAQVLNLIPVLQKQAVIGVEALRGATPVDTGLTSMSWSYVIEVGPFGFELSWINHNENRGANVALLLQYGHGTGTGGYVQGRDYINPTMKPIFDNIADEIWKEVTRL